MKNLILNARWHPGPGGEPRYFSSVGPITYDNFSLDGSRSCSITMPAGGTKARLIYNTMIPMNGRKALNFSYKIRTIDAHGIVLVAEFFDEAQKPIEASRISITQRVTHEFTRQSVKFQAPRRAKFVRLSIEFSGKITACTFCAPEAYFV